MTRLSARSVAILAFGCLFALGCGTGDEGSSSSSSGASSGSSGSGSGCTTAGSNDPFGITRKADMQVSRQGQAVKSLSTVKVTAGGLATGGTADTRFDIVNAAATDAAAELKIRGITLDYSEPALGKDGAKPAFECLLDYGDGKLVPCDGAEESSIVPAGATGVCTTATERNKLTLVVRFNKPGDDNERKALVKIRSEGDEKYDPPKSFQLALTSKVGIPALNANPDPVQFDTVKKGLCDDKILKVTNTGEADLIIDQLELAPKDPKPWAIEFEHDGKTVSIKGTDGAKVFADPAIIVPPNESLQIIVKYCALDGFEHQDFLVVHSNDPQKKHEIKIIANDKVACLTVVPDKAVNFGFVPIGHSSKRPVVLKSCGSDLVKISGLTVKDDKDSVYKADTSGIVSLKGNPVSESNPIELGPNEQQTVEVECTPESAAKDVKPGDSQYMANLGLLDNTVQPDKLISLLCNGTATNCPTSVIVAEEGEEIVPQSELHLNGSQSFAGPNQAIAKYTWKVLKQPKGSEDHVFWPNANAPDVLFGAKTAYAVPISNKPQQCTTYADCKKGQFCAESAPGKSDKICFTAAINIAGEYQFQLTVEDKAGNKNCVDAKQTVLVIPDQAIHVELLWDTPGDTDKFDKGLDAGADLDLHFSHQTAMKAQICTNPPKMCGASACLCQQDLDKDGTADPWFNNPYDAYWFNAAPNWGSADPAIDDNPSLDLDDTDGWGPENMNLNNPQNNTVYSVGVHYWDAHTFGDSVANVRIYILGKLVADMFSVTMKQCDMWWVKQIEWPSGQLIDFKDGAGNGVKNGKITPKYNTKFAATLGAKCG